MAEVAALAMTAEKGNCNLCDNISEGAGQKDQNLPPVSILFTLEHV